VAGKSINKKNEILKKIDNNKKKEERRESWKNE